MKESMRLQVTLSEIREKMNNFSGTPEEREALKKQHQETEQAFRVAVEKEHEEDEKRAKGDPESPDPESRQLAELEDRAKVGDVVDGLIRGRDPEGATAELQQHLGLNPDQIPVTLLRRQPGEMSERRAAAQAAGVEHRTDGVTPAPSDVGRDQQPVIPYVFPMAAASFLDIPQPSVMPGDKVYTVLSTPADPGTPAEGAEQAHSTGALTAFNLEPGRIQASLFFSQEDKARMPALEPALRMNLADALSDQLDAEVLTGANGLFTGTNLTDNAAGAEDSFASYRSRFVFSQVDGRYAGGTEMLKILLGASTFAHMGGKYRSDESDMDALTTIKRETMGCQVSSHVPAVASKKQEAIVRRTRDPMPMACPVWMGVTAIYDEVTQAKAGEIVLTFFMLYACQVLRKDAGLVKVEAQVAA